MTMFDPQKTLSTDVKLMHGLRDVVLREYGPGLGKTTFEKADAIAVEFVPMHQGNATPASFAGAQSQGERRR